jgi:hypothetical protein
MAGLRGVRAQICVHCAIASRHRDKTDWPHAGIVVKQSFCHQQLADSILASGKKGGLKAPDRRGESKIALKKESQLTTGRAAQARLF